MINKTILRKFMASQTVVLSLGFGLLFGIFYYSLLQYENYTLTLSDKLLNDKFKQELQSTTEAAASLLGKIYQSPNFTKEQKLSLARELLGSARFGNEGYFFVFENGTGVNLIHGAKPELQGTNMWDNQDANNNYYIRQLDEAAAKGINFVEYQFPKPNTVVAFPKLGVAVSVPGTNMWVGSGRYIDSIEANQAAIHDDVMAITNRTLLLAGGVFGGLLLVTLGVVLFIANRITQPVRKITGVINAIAQGKGNPQLAIYQQDEVGQLADAFRQMMSTLQESEARKNAILNAIPDLMFLLSREGRYLDFKADNTLDLAMLPNQVIGSYLTDYLPADVTAHILKHINAALDTGQLQQIEYTIDTLGGRQDFEMRLVVAGPDQTLAIVRRVTEQKQTEETLAKSEQKYRTLFDTMAQGVIYHDANDYIIMANPAACRILGVPLEQILGRTSTDPRWQSIHQDGRSFPGEMHPAVVAAKTGNPVNNVLIGVFNPLCNGYRWIKVNAMPLFNPGEARPYQIYTTFDDITDQIQAEWALSESGIRFRTLVECSPDAILLSDLNTGLVLEANQTAVNLWRMPKENIIGAQITQLHPSHLGITAQSDWKQLSTVSKDRPAHLIESVILQADGTEILVEIIVQETLFQGKFVLYSIFRDITGRKQAEEKLRQLSLAIQQSPVSVVITNTQGAIQYVNPKFVQVTGYTAEEVAGQNPRILQSGKHSPKFYKQLWQTIANGKEWRGEFQNKRKNGKLFWESTIISPIKNDSGKITHYVAVKEDVTEQKYLEQQIRQQERLAAVGQLAAGIAHDFNNLLTGIIGYAELLQYSPDIPESARPDLNRISQQGARAAQLIRQILDFSRQSSREPHPLDLVVYLKETIKFMERTIPETIRINFNFSEEDCIVHADPAQLQQVLTNLAVNARDAMPQGGTLTLALSTETFSPDASRPSPDLEPGHWVCLKVIDTGTGIAPEILPHIFEPFFTTKKIGEGTGLGLAQVYGIIKQHNGSVVVDSQVGQGTTFAIYLPALPKDKSPGLQRINRELPLGQGEVILVVEDDLVVRTAMQTMLTRLNYQSLIAENGREALNIYRMHQTHIALVLTDMVMPEMDGFALIAAFEAEFPAARIMMMSGYSGTNPKPEELSKNYIGLLNKPLKLHDLAESLQKALC